MSVQHCEICGEPGLFSETIGEGNLRRIVHPHKDATFAHPNCTRTHESPVGEKGWMNREASAYANYVGLDAKPTAVDEPELQFIVIDLQTHCVVKMEKGGGMAGYGRRLEEGDVEIFKTTFAKLRDTWDKSIKPVPRIETELNQSGYTDYILRYKDGDTICVQFLTQSQFTALSELAGKPLPIYEGGIWKKLLASDSKVGIDIGECVSIWRFTR